MLNEVTVYDIGAHGNDVCKVQGGYKISRFEDNYMKWRFKFKLLERCSKENKF